MFGRRTIYAGVLASAIGGPYMISTGDVPKKMGDLWASLSSSKTEPDPLSVLSTPEVYHSTTFSEGNVPHNIPVAGNPVEGLGEIFRFDISPQWVMARWPRITSCLADTTLSGMRVPLVTGNKIDDLAGSLTYYFDDRQQLQRITFVGTTGDASRLATLVQDHYKLKLEPTLGGALYIRSWNRRPISALRIEASPVIRADQPHRRQQIMLELNRPKHRLQLSPSFQAILQSDQAPA